MIKMFWYKHPEYPNFGDELGPYIVQKLTGQKVVFKEITRWPFDRTILTVGSILSASTRNCIVWGSGIINQTDFISGGKFLAVRGPMTQKKLKEQGVIPPPVVGDPALLLPLVYSPTIEKKFEVGIIPHVVDYRHTVEIFKNTNTYVIDLTRDVETVINDILLCSHVLSTSLHGIIVSHAYGIPALHFELSEKLFGDGVKFLDYYKSIGVEGFATVTFDYNSDTKTIIELFEINKDRILPQVDISMIEKTLIGCAPFKVLKKYKTF